jgi:Peptidase family M1 domain
MASPTAAQSREIASYDIEVVLDPATHELGGSLSVRWRNTTEAPTSEIWFHLYLNAFSGSETTWMRELAADPLGGFSNTDDEWGWTRITRLGLADGEDLMPGLSFERPDDGNENDFTVVRVELPRAVPPGEAVELELDFEAQLPRVIARTGFSGDFHMVGQWFPKIGVFEGEDGWNCHQFHAASEFFADFGSYRVSLRIPRGWVVGATGEEVSREPVGTDDVVVFQARGVHDFAWTTAPPALMSAFDVEFEPGRHVPMVWLERAGRRLDLGAADLELPPMTIRFLVPQTQGMLIPRMIRAARLAMAWFGLYLGPYPHAQLTVVSPPPGALGAGGMEYPTLITTGASQLDASPVFSWRSNIESVTVHEIGHQYFQGMLASNEFEDAWLDEGLTTWAENRCLSDVITDGLVPEIRWARVWGMERVWASFEEPPLTMDRPNWEQRRIVDAFFASYAKPALAVKTLEGLYGEDRLVRAMRDYVGAHRYGHPSGDDFQASLELSLGEDLDWFFGTVIRGDQRPDWAVLGVTHDEIESADGMLWGVGGWTEREDEEASEPDGEGPWKVAVEIGRRGDLVGPVEVELVWADGRSERRQWDGRERWIRWHEESSDRLQQVIVDPDGVWVLETRRADNYWRDQVADSNALWWLDGALGLVSFLTVPWS